MATCNGSMQCKLCGAPILLTFARGADDPEGRPTLVLTNSAELAEHMSVCAVATVEHRQAGQAATPARLTSPAHLPPFVAKGRRPCVMCGVFSEACAAKLTTDQAACCGACGDGNTHPAPEDTVPCGQWVDWHAERHAS